MDSQGTLAKLEQRVRPHLRGPARVAAQRLRRFLESTGLGSVTASAGGLRITGGLSDRKLLQKFSNGRLEPFTLELWSRLCADCNVVDVGAHIGIFTLTAAKALGSSGRVFALEPNPISRRLLEENVRRGQFGNVTIIPVAASDSARSAVLHVVTGDRSQSSIVNRAIDCDGEVAIRTERLDDLVPRSSEARVVKIDTEGSEPAILRGMTSMISSVEAMVVECNDFSLREAGSSSEELYRTLVDAGFELHAVDEYGRRLRPLPASSDKAFNVLALKPGSAAAGRVSAAL